MKVVAAFLVNTLFNFAIGLMVAKFLGPEEFGRFALALSLGSVMQTAMFEWIRLSAIRFYSARSRAEQPELRSTLDVCFALIAGGVALTAAGLMLTGVELPMQNALIGLGVGASITNGLFDYNTAMVRARFEDALYARLILAKNLLAFVVTAGGAYLFQSATMALLGVCVSMAGSAILFRAAMRDHGAGPRLADRALASRCMQYAAPIVIANVLYICIPLANRALLARGFGYAETGQFSLAFDIGQRLVAAVGSALDVLLFQMAVRADERHGPDEGREQVARNMATVFAIMAPVCAGVWLTLPSIEHLVVPARFQGPFEHYFSVLLPGHFAFGMVCFAINPVFQIAKRTLPMIVGALVACLADIVLVALLPASPASFAVAQSGAMTAGLVALLIYAAASGGRFPRARDPLFTILAAVAMLGAVYPMRAFEPGVATLALEAIAGMAVYAGFIALFDIAGLRGVGLGAFQALARRARTV